MQVTTKYIQSFFTLKSTEMMMTIVKKEEIFFSLLKDLTMMTMHISFRFRFEIELKMEKNIV